MYTETGRKLPQNYDIIFTCDLMEFPLRTLVHKIYFLLETWGSRGPQVVDKILKVKIFTVKSLFYFDNNIQQPIEEEISNICS